MTACFCSGVRFWRADASIVVLLYSFSNGCIPGCTTGCRNEQRRKKLLARRTYQRFVEVLINNTQSVFGRRLGWLDGFELKLGGPVAVGMLLGSELVEGTEEMLGSKEYCNNNAAVAQSKYRLSVRTQDC